MQPFDSFLADLNHRPGIIRVYVGVGSTTDGFVGAYDFTTLDYGSEVARGPGSVTTTTIQKGRMIAGARRVSAEVMVRIRAAAGLEPLPQWAEEFRDFAFADMPAIPAGFEDTSWGNDMCPSFTNTAAGLIIWVDYADPALREFEEGPRFNLAACDADGATGESIASSDDWSDILTAIAAATPSEV